MNCLATFFADQLSRERPLTQEESNKLAALICRQKGTRRMWKASDDRELSRLLRKPGMTAEAIGQKMGRSTLSVRMRVHRMKGGQQRVRTEG